MSSPLVAIVSRDPRCRAEVAAAFDHAPSSWIVELHESAPEGADAVVLGPDVEGAGLRYDPQSPGAVLDEVARVVTRSTRRVVVVSSPVGGSGATTVALHLAQAAASAASSCLLELHVGGKALHRVGVHDSAARSWADVDDGPESLILSALPVAGGFRVLGAPAEAPEPAVEAVAGLVTRAGASFEVAVVDVPPGPLLAEAAAHASVGVLVLPPTVPAAHGARRMLLSNDDLPWAVVTNRTGPGGETTRAELERILERRIALELPCAPALRDAEGEGRLLVSRRYRWSRAVARLAGAVLRG